MTIATWLETAQADAERRGLPELSRMLEALARSIEIVRAADWNEREPGTIGTHGPAGNARQEDRPRPDAGRDAHQ